MSSYDNLKYYPDSEVNQVLMSLASHPMLKALMSFTYPDKDERYFCELFQNIHSIYDFQTQIIYYTMQRILEKTSEKLTVSGFEQLDDNSSYFFISNHRDILLDTSLLNVKLHEYNKIMTASAVGDNLVQKSFLMELAKLNRNFIVRRGLSPRELLQSSKEMSAYIYHLLTEENRSVWIAQREGRTKDGWDETHTGVLKMIGMNSDEENLMDYFKKLRIVPVSISYEYDPTDKLKMPQLMAELSDEIYIKEKNEDFINLMSGVLGQKKRIHIEMGKPLDEEIEIIKAEHQNPAKQIQELAKTLDKSIVGNYKLWPTNYIAYDLLNKTKTFQKEYTEEEKQLFLRRLELRVDKNNANMVNSFLAMYANPVSHKTQLNNDK